MYKRYLSLILLAAMIAMNGCTSSDPAEDVSTGETKNETVTESVETEPVYELVEGDFDGKEFVIYTSPDIQHFIYAQEITGEAVNDTLYNTELQTEERYDAVVSYILSAGDSGTGPRVFADQVLAGDGSCNLLYGNSVYMAQQQQKGIYKNLLDMEGFQFDAPWWSAQAIGELTVANQMYLGSSSIHYAQFSRACTVYINKDLAADHGLTVPYNDVRNGKWTLDNMMSMSEEIYVDENGNGTVDEEDTFGFVTDQWVNPFAFSAGFSMVEKTDDDSLLKVSFDLEKMDALVDFFYTWLYEKQSTCLTAKARDMFVNDQGLFFATTVEQAALVLRNSEVNYGFLPYPKYDETQENYRPLTAGMIWAMPNLPSDEVFDTAITEALACYRQEYLIPVYYEVAICGKLADTHDDLEMLEIINKGMAECFVNIYRDAFPMQLGLEKGLGVETTQVGNNFMSYYAANIRATEKALAAFAEFYRENMN